MSHMSYLASQSEDLKKERARLGERSKQSVVQSWWVAKKWVNDILCITYKRESQYPQIAWAVRYLCQWSTDQIDSKDDVCYNSLPWCSSFLHLIISHYLSYPCWVTGGRLSPDTKRSGGYCRCEICEQRAGVEGLVFLITRIRESREAPLGTVVGNVWWEYVLLLDRRDKWTLLIFCYTNVIDNQGKWAKSPSK